jgi:hypothetical protein
MNLTPHIRPPWKLVLTALVAGALGLAAGCVQTGGYSREAAKGAAELRGVLTAAPTNAPVEVVAILNSRSGTRAPCALRSVDDGVAAEIRALLAKGGVVIVTGVPGPQSFRVDAIRLDGQRRKRAPGDDEDDASGEKRGIWSHISWGSVPAKPE